MNIAIEHGTSVAHNLSVKTAGAALA